MRKLIYGGAALTIGLFFNSCEKVNIDGTRKTDEVKNVIIEDLNDIFKKIEDKNEYNTTKSLSISIDSISNEQNPYNEVGVEHNSVLAYIRSLNLNDTNFCKAIPAVNSKFEVNLDLTCKELKLLIQSGTDMTFDKDNNYSSEFLEHLVDKGKISENEFLIVNTTFANVSTLSDLKLRISKIKAIEDYTINTPLLNKEEKGRVLRTFAIYRYTTYYWEVEAGYSFSSIGVAEIADAIAEHWALNSLDSPAQDGKDVHIISGIVSAFFTFMFSFF